MVNLRPIQKLWPAIALILLASQANALLPRTQSDLRVVEDRLRYEFGSRSERRQDRVDEPTLTPILVAPPQAYWEESKTDFGAAVVEVLSRVFSDPGALISCAQCFESRVYLASDSRTVIQNGELSLTDLARLKEQSAYKQAKSVLISKETPGGIEVRLLAIDDGRILYTGLADSTKTLAAAEPPLRLARELDRRSRGQSLSYVNIDIGLYPQLIGGLKFLEQWGSHNQHLSGLAFGLYNPTAAIGATYQYMLPFNRRMTVGLTGYYSLQGLFSSASTDISKAFIGQASFNYALSGAYGVFISGDTAGVVSVGVSLLNPVLFPFLL